MPLQAIFYMFNPSLRTDGMTREGEFEPSCAVFLCATVIRNCETAASPFQTRRIETTRS